MAEDRVINIVEQFHALVARSITKKGFYPLYGFVLRRGKDGLESVDMIALALNSEEARHHMHAQIEIPDPERGEAIEVVFGIDYTTKTGQGNEFGDCVGVHHWKIYTPWRHGVIDYKWNGRGESTVRPINWDNRFWREALWEQHKAWSRRARTHVIVTTDFAGRRNLLGMEGLSAPQSLVALIKARATAVCLSSWPEGQYLMPEYHESGAILPWLRSHKDLPQGDVLLGEVDPTNEWKEYTGTL